MSSKRSKFFVVPPISSVYNQSGAGGGAILFAVTRRTENTPWRANRLRFSRCSLIGWFRDDRLRTPHRSLLLANSSITHVWSSTARKVTARVDNCWHRTIQIRYSTDLHESNSGYLFNSLYKEDVMWSMFDNHRPGMRKTGFPSIRVWIPITSSTNKPGRSSHPGVMT